MKVLVDGRPLLPIGPQLGPTGVGRWTAGALRALSSAAPDWEIVVAIVTRDEIDLDTRSLGDNVSLRPIEFPERWFRRLLVAGIPPRVGSRVGDPDVMLGPGFVTWPGRHSEVPVIHDLAFLRYPDSVQRRNLAFLRLLIPRVIRRAAAVVTVSQTVRAEIAATYDLDLDRIHVVPNAPGPHAGTTAGETRRLILFVGTFEPRKNLRRVLDAYARLRAQRPDVPPMVVVGGPGWRDAGELQRLARDTDGVEVVGYIDDAKLSALYREARMLVFPSLYEGFGLPIVEAMSAGTPVITSDMGAMREVGGQAVLYVNPQDVSAIAGMMERILDDPVLARELAAKGEERVRDYTWERSGLALKRALQAATER